MGMSDLIQIKLTLPKGMVDKIDQLVNEKEYASRADFGHKAVFSLLRDIEKSKESKYKVTVGDKDI